MGSSRRSGRDWASWTLYPSQITYGSVPISKRLLDNPGQPNLNSASPDTPPSLAQFASTRIAQSHVQMEQVLGMLEFNLDNKRDDKSITIKQAIYYLDWPKWREELETEYDFLIKNKIWKLTAILENRYVITSRWCFKLKKHRDGQILKCKARWVAQGIKQEKGIHFVETFAAVVKPISYKCLFGVSDKRGYKICQMDVVTAFFYGFLNEIIYVEQPHLFKFEPELVCYLRKDLYSLKQAPQAWYRTIAHFLKKLSLERL